MIFVTALVDERTIWASDPKMHTFLVLEGTNNLFSLTTIKKKQLKVQQPSMWGETSSGIKRSPAALESST